MLKVPVNRVSPSSLTIRMATLPVRTHYSSGVVMSCCSHELLSFLGCCMAWAFFTGRKNRSPYLKAAGEALKLDWALYVVTVVPVAGKNMGKANVATGSL